MANSFTEKQTFGNVADLARMPNKDVHGYFFQHFCKTGKPPRLLSSTFNEIYETIIKANPLRRMLDQLSGGTVPLDPWDLSDMWYEGRRGKAWCALGGQ